jgi:hypothetical protein
VHIEGLPLVCIGEAHELVAYVGLHWVLLTFIDIGHVEVPLAYGYLDWMPVLVVYIEYVQLTSINVDS